MRIVLFANTEWYLYNFRLSLAKALRDEGHDLLLISPPGPYGERLKELGFNWQPVPMTRRSLNPFRELGLLVHLVRLFRKQHIDLVHGFTIKSAVYGSLAARLAGIPGRINAVAGMGYVFSSSDLKARLLRPFVRLALRLAFAGDHSRLILQNPDDVAVFTRSALMPVEHIRLVLGSGVDCSRFSPSSNKKLDSNPATVLFAARLLWDKGVAEFIEAIRQLRAGGTDAKFVIAGEPDEGNPAAVPTADIHAWQREGLVEWLGHVDDMAALYRSVDIMVLPSYREGLPKGLIEAAACALPIITTDVPGCREVVDHELTGLLVEPRRPEAVAQTIERLAGDAQLRARMGRAGREKMLAQFDEQIVIRQTLSVYAELLDYG